MFQFVILLFLSEPVEQFVNLLPIIIQDGEEHFPSSISQIECAGNSILIRDGQNPLIVEFSSDGFWIRDIGGRGQGPGELGFLGASAMAAEGECLWVFHGNHLTLFRHGLFEKTHQIGKPFPISHPYSSNSISLHSGELYSTLAGKDNSLAGFQIQWMEEKPGFFVYAMAAL